MYCILYESSTTRPLAAADVAAIVGVAIPLNRACGVTGLLLYAEMSDVPGIPGTFVQWLEGAEADVTATYDRIFGDSRHDNVRVIARGLSGEITGADARLFPDWDMTSERMADLPATLFGFLDHVRGTATP